MPCESYTAARVPAARVTSYAVTVRLTGDDLFQCPYLHMEDVGTLTFNEREVEARRLPF